MSRSEGGAVSVRAEDRVLKTSAGPMACFRAAPGAAPPRGAVVVLMEAFGLTDHIRNVCERLAAAGYLAMAPDLYRRFGPDNVFSGEQIDAALACYQKMQPDQALEDMDSVLQELPAALPVAAVGFCMGGMLAFIAACERGSRLAAASCFYGAGIDRELGRLERLRIPLQLHFAAEDPFVPESAVDAIAAALSDRDVELSVHPGTGHGFMCEEREQYHAAAAAQAWSALLGFLERKLL